MTSVNVYRLNIVMRFIAKHILDILYGEQSCILSMNLKRNAK